MDFIANLLSICQQGALHIAALPGGLPVSLLLAGLAGSLVHCVGMCGPFVLGQVMIDAEQTRGGYGEWRRLGGAALAPYHLGRFTTYTALGAMAGGVTAVFAAMPAFASLSRVLLVLAALLMVLQAFGLAAGAASPFASPLAGPLARLAAPLSAARGAWARYGLGVVLGFLPCGLLYGALAAAGGTGSAADGALAMAAFTVGTVPALVAVGWGGTIARRRLRGVARWVAAPLLLANAVVMLALASRTL